MDELERQKREHEVRLAKLKAAALVVNGYLAGERPVLSEPNFRQEIKDAVCLAAGLLAKELR